MSYNSGWFYLIFSPLIYRYHITNLNLQFISEKNKYFWTKTPSEKDILRIIKYEFLYFKRHVFFYFQGMLL